MVAVAPRGQLEIIHVAAAVDGGLEILAPRFHPFHRAWLMRMATNAMSASSA